jgi:hypothetical protein
VVDSASIAGAESHETPVGPRLVVDLVRLHFEL